jgi:hypothetical protein
MSNDEWVKWCDAKLLDLRVMGDSVQSLADAIRVARDGGFSALMLGNAERRARIVFDSIKNIYMDLRTYNHR